MAPVNSFGDDGPLWPTRYYMASDVTIASRGPATSILTRALLFAGLVGFDHFRRRLRVSRAKNSGIPETGILKSLPGRQEDTLRVG